MENINGDKSLKERIDTKFKNGNIETEELKEFIFGENKQENIKELGNYLDDKYFDTYDDLAREINNCIIDEMTRMSEDIKNKIKNNESLDKYEMTIMFLYAIKNKPEVWYMTSKIDLGFANISKPFNPDEPIEKICNGEFLSYIQIEYNNLNYYPGYSRYTNHKNSAIETENNRNFKINEPYKTQTPQEIKEKEKKQLESDYEGLPKLKENIDINDFNKLLKWAEDNYGPEIIKVGNNAEAKHWFKDHKYLSGYIKYEKIVFAYTKYIEITNAKHSQIIEESGYANEEEFKKDTKAIEELDEFLRTNYGKGYLKYIEKIRETQNKYFENENEIEEAQDKYSKFGNEAGKIKEEYDDLFKKLEVDEESLSDDEKIQMLVELFEYSEKIKNTKNQCGGEEIINKYISYEQEISLIERPEEPIMNKIQKLYSKINFDKYNKYCELFEKSGIKENFNSITSMQSILSNVNDPNFPSLGLKEEQRQKQLEQDYVDAYWEAWKQKDIISYRVAQSIVTLENLLVEGVAGSFMNLIPMFRRYDKDETVAFNDWKNKKLGGIPGFAGLERRLSTSQSAPIYIGEDTGIGDFFSSFSWDKFNITADNMTTQVVQGVGQMLLLIYGGGAIAKGLEGLGVASGVASKAGLFLSSMYQQAGESYIEGINSGLSENGAFAYSFFSSCAQSGLELVSPNEILLGKGSSLGKTLIQSICKNESGKKIIGKFFIKTVLTEILEENIQEGLQLAAGNIINDFVNGVWGTDLPSDWSINNFIQTAIITTLTTGITTGFSAGKKGIQIFNSNQQELVGWVISNPELFNEVINLLDNSINGKLKIPNTNIEDIRKLRLTLSIIQENISKGENNNQTNTQENTEQNKKENTENQTEDEIETENTENTENRINYIIEILTKNEKKLIEIIGSKFHEEWRKSMLNPDGTYESRIEKVTDQEWIDQHGGQTQVDLIGTIFEDLPKEWKQENLEAAKFVIGQIKEKIENGEDITDPQIIEKIAEEIHNKWLERNGIEGSFEDQRVAYNQLTEEEKAKDRNQVLRTIEIMKDYSILENETNQEIEGFTETTTQNEENDEVVEQIEPTSTERINEYTIQEGLTEEEKENIEELKKLGIIFDDGNEDIKGLTKQDVKNIAELQKLGFDNEDIVIGIKEIKGLTEQDIQNIPELQKLGFYNIIIIGRIENIKGLTKQDIQNIPELQKLGFEIRITNLQEIKGLTKQDIQNIPELQKLGFTITIDNIGNIKGLTKQDIIIISELQKIGFDIDENMLEYINWLKENNKLNNENIQVFKKLSKIRDISDIKGIVTIYKNLSEQDIENIKKLSEQDIENIKKLQELDIVIDIKEINILKGITLTNEEKQLIAKIIQKGYNIDANALITIINNIDIIETENIDYKKYKHSKEEIKVHQKCITGIIVETIQQYVENAIQEEKDITTLEIIDKIRPLLLSINDKETKAIILGKIGEIVKKFNTVRKYLDFENGPYKTPKELLCAMRGIDDSKIKDVTEDIRVIQHGVGLTFFVGDQNSFDIILDEGTGNEGVAGFYSQRSAIDELRCTLSVVNGSISEQIINVGKGKATTDELIAIKKRLSGEDPYQKDWVEDRRTILHEGQHNWNSYFMPDKHSGLAISRAKDEIIANLREGSKIEYIKEVLTGGSYKYGLEGKARTRHKLKVKELLTYVNDLIELTKNPETGLTREKVISMLADTPTNERKKLHTCIGKAVKLHNQKNVSKSKIEKLKNAFIIQIKERAWNHKLIKNLIEFWNPLFPGYIIKLEAFRRSGTAKKENVINNLENCNSIEEIKYILNDPQYSHIGRGPNNLGGIEISNIIDEVIAGKLTIDYIPIEIRQHVQNLIK